MLLAARRLGDDSGNAGDQADSDKKSDQAHHNIIGAPNQPHPNIGQNPPKDDKDPPVNNDVNSAPSGDSGQSTSL